MRLIDADALIKNYFDRCRTEFEVINHCISDENVVHIIQNAPTVFDDNAYSQGYKQGTCDSKNDRPQGEWIDEGIRGYVCSACGDRLAFSDEYDYQTNFCPNCGAKMEGGAE